MRRGRWIGAAVLVGATLGWPSVAWADGGAYLDLDRTHYLPGQTAHAEGYVSVPRAKQHLFERGPFYVFVVPPRTVVREGRPIPANAVRVGTVSIERERGTTFELRSSFVVPELRGDSYWLYVCNDPCTISGFREPLTGTISIVATTREGKLLTEVSRLNGRMSSLRRQVRKAERADEELRAQLGVAEVARSELGIRVRELEGPAAARATHRADVRWSRRGRADLAGGFSPWSRSARDPDAGNTSGRRSPPRRRANPRRPPSGRRFPSGSLRAMAVKPRSPGLGLLILAAATVSVTAGSSSCATARAGRSDARRRPASSDERATLSTDDERPFNHPRTPAYPAPEGRRAASGLLSAPIRPSQPRGSLVIQPDREGKERRHDRSHVRRADPARGRQPSQPLVLEPPMGGRRASVPGPRRDRPPRFDHGRTHPGPSRRRAPVVAHDDQGPRPRARGPDGGPGGRDGQGRAAGDLRVGVAGGSRREPRRPHLPGPVPVSGQQRSDPRPPDNNALLRADQIARANGDTGTTWMAPVVADAEAASGSAHTRSSSRRP